MQVVSTRWLPGLQTPRIGLATWVEVWDGIGGGWLASLAIEGGTVGDDWTNATRRSCSGLLVTDPTGALAPGQLDDLLAPAGNEIVPYKGIVYPGGSMASAFTGPYDPTVAAAAGYEAMAMGRLLIEDCLPSHTASGDYALTVDGSDRGATVARSEFTQPYATATGASTDQAVESMINAAVSGLTYNFPTLTTITPPSAYNVGDNPWDAAGKLSSDASQLLFPDRHGTMTMTAAVDPVTQPLAGSYGPGTGCLLLTGVARPQSNKNVPNWIIGISSGSGITVPLQAEWQDTDPNSFTYINGKYPRTVQRIDTSTLTSLGDVQAMVNAQGHQNKGRFEQVQFSLLDNAAHDAGDVVYLVDPVTGTSGVYVVDRLTHTLGHGNPLTGTGRRIA